MTRTTRSILTGLCVTGLACSGTSGAREAMPDPTMLEGRLRLAGSDPNVMVMLQPAAGGPEVQLTGEHLGELERLSGIDVSVVGSLSTAPRRTVDVASYQIQSVNGRRPSVGVVVSRGGAFWLEGDTSVRLSIVPDGLRNQIGAKVWIVGEMTDGSLRPESYGIIRDP